jgi:hypothetical protein
VEVEGVEPSPGWVQSPPSAPRHPHETVSRETCWPFVFGRYIKNDVAVMVTSFLMSPGRLLVYPMSDEVNWRFYGYVTPADGWDVQEWFDGLDDDGREVLLDAVAYLQHIPIQQWRKPDFVLLNEGLSEIRAKDNVHNKTYRIYGFFWPQGQRYVYTFLLGNDKKVKNPKQDINEARKRLKNVETKKANIHEFEFSR